MLDSRIRARRVERGRDRVGRHVQVVGLGVVESGGDVLPVVGERRRDLLLGGDQHLGASSPTNSRNGLEVLDREQLGDVGAVLGVLERGDLRELAMFLGELGGRRDLDLSRVLERALRERRRPRSDSISSPNRSTRIGAVLGRGEQIQQAAADRELAAVLDLVDALVAGRDEVASGLVEVHQLALASVKPCGRSDGSGTFSESATALTTTTGAGRFGVAGGSSVRLQQRVERGDPLADQVRRRRQMRLVGDAAARVVADLARREPRAQAGGEVTRGAVVAGDDDRRGSAGRGRQRRDQERRAATARRTRGRRPARASGGLRIVVRVVQQAREHRWPYRV